MNFKVATAKYKAHSGVIAGDKLGSDISAIFPSQVLCSHISVHTVTKHRTHSTVACLVNKHIDRLIIIYISTGKTKRYRVFFDGTISITMLGFFRLWVASMTF